MQTDTRQFIEVFYKIETSGAAQFLKTIAAKPEFSSQDLHSRKNQLLNVVFRPPYVHQGTPVQIGTYYKWRAGRLSALVKLDFEMGLTSVF